MEKASCEGEKHNPFSSPEPGYVPCGGQNVLSYCDWAETFVNVNWVGLTPLWLAKRPCHNCCKPADGQGCHDPFLQWGRNHFGWALVQSGCGEAVATLGGHSPNSGFPSDVAGWELLWRGVSQEKSTGECWNEVNGANKVDCSG